MADLFGAEGPEGESGLHSGCVEGRRGLPALVSKVVACAIAVFAGAAMDAAADPGTSYPKMVPIRTYLMDRAEEIALARSAAPASISKDATILVMTPTGYEVAATGSNGFVCMVGRSFNGPADWPERWNPKIRAAECLNPPAARSVAPIAKLRTAMFLAGRTPGETMERVQAALSSREVPPLEPGAMSYMMSKSSYLTDEGDPNMPHLMFFVPVKDPADWGANTADSPLFGGSYWFTTTDSDADAANLPAIAVFLIQVATWSDGTPAPAHAMQTQRNSTRHADLP